MVIILECQSSFLPEEIPTFADRADNIIGTFFDIRMLCKRQDFMPA